VELTQRAQNLERCFTRFNRYDHADCQAVDDLPEDNDTGTYRISVRFPRADGSQYLLTATPIKGQAGDTKCGSLTIDQVGSMAVSTATPATDCWQR
jgi:type IV pilus assembly protein PilE